MSVFKRVVVGCDHAAVAARGGVADLMRKLGLEVEDCGTKTCDRVDYPDIAGEVCRKVNEKEGSCGILLCGSGIGMSISANKHKGIRAAICHDNYTAAMSRKHNNANILCLGARTTGPDVISEMCTTFVNTEFEGGRHCGRVEKLMSPKPELKVTDSNPSIIVVGCDHADFESKNAVVEFIKTLPNGPFEVIDAGVHSADRVDYPDIAASVCQKVASTGGRGILMCGSGIGMEITANKFNGIRAALCHEAYTARVCREHNNANVLCMGVRTSGPDLHKEMVKAFLSTPFVVSSDSRHCQRVGKIAEQEVQQGKL
eukprot:TRINITY_DN2079_c0_g1_i1.p1 TRINITY_DN2079_c0_g1~~TRINITY_DN2079_c0_g1_i1.p1  ORF type:complete len:314 (+),score=71.64 TRINITY_DN2079_c0_g1_i1:50-991(+)